MMIYKIKLNFYPITIAFLLVIHTLALALILTRLDIPAEMYLFSLMVSKGLVPVKDFFENHSFLLYYILAPLVTQKSFLYFKLFYDGILTVNLILFMIIVRKQTTKTGFILSTWLYIASTGLLFFRTFWYEAMITTCYLVVYYLLVETNFKYKILLISIFAALAASIKPTAAIILLPLIFLTGNLLVVIPTLLLWGGIIYYLFAQHAFNDFIKSFISFDGNLLKYNPHAPLKNFAYLVPPVSIALWGFSIAQKQYTRKTIISFIFFLASFMFILHSTDPSHFFPIVTFFIICLAGPFPLLKNTPIPKKIFLSSIILYCLFLSINLLYIVLPFTIIHRNYPFIYPKEKSSNEVYDKNLAFSLKKRVGNENFWSYWGNSIEAYYYLGKLPPTYYPITWPLLQKSVSDYDMRTIEGLEKNNVKYIVFQAPLTPDQVPSPRLWKYIHTHYKKVVSNKEYDLYKRKI